MDNQEEKSHVQLQVRISRSAHHRLRIHALLLDVPMRKTIERLIDEHVPKYGFPDDP